MRIAIVDDIASERETLADGIHVQLARISLDAAIFSFGSGADFLAAAVKERFDLVFLDIYMGNENGVNTAQALRRFDADCLLVFTTTSTDHALDAFRVRAFHYLVNPCTREDLDALFDEIAKRLPTDDRYIEVNAAGGSVRLHFREILYAEHDQLIARAIVESFAQSHHAALAVMAGGEHWFHTEEQLAFLRGWLQKMITQPRLDEGSGE